MLRAHLDTFESQNWWRQKIQTISLYEWNVKTLMSPVHQQSRSGFETALTSPSCKKFTFLWKYFLKSDFTKRSQLSCYISSSKSNIKLQNLCVHLKLTSIPNKNKNHSLHTSHKCLLSIHSRQSEGNIGKQSLLLKCVHSVYWVILSYFFTL